MSLSSLLKAKRRSIQKKLRAPRCKCPFEKLMAENMDFYERTIGHRFDIEHPVSFTEKIQWYKMYYNDPRIKGIVDKAEFKRYIEEKLGPGHTIPLIACWDSFSDFKKDWDALPASFCLKSTISSAGQNIIPVKDKSAVDKKEIFKRVRTWYDPKNTMLDSWCRGYYSCTPRVLAEEYAENIAGQLYDYKLFCFDGKPYTIYAAMDRFKDKEFSMTYYDLEWNKLDVRRDGHNNGDIPKPAHLKEMIDYAAVLSEGFPFVRVDFFDTEEKLYLAELTFYPGGGMVKYDPEEFNMKLGELFVLPKKSEQCRR